MEDKIIKEIALFRYALIAPVINDTFHADTKMEYFREIAQKKHILPNGKEVMYAAGTIKSWYLKYNKIGFDALYPKTRSDLGMTRTLDHETIHRIHELKDNFPYITATMIYQKLIEEGYITKDSMSLSTITRYIKRNKLKGKQVVGKQRKAYEMEHVNDCWQADTSHAVFLNEKGKKRKTYLILFIDDASRMIVGSDFFYEDTAVNMQKVFKQAVQTYGVPKRIYVDNGSSYRNEQLSLICATLGVTLIHTQAYDAAAIMSSKILCLVSNKVLIYSYFFCFYST
jgi:hypothetical protein